MTFLTLIPIHCTLTPIIVNSWPDMSTESKEIYLTVEKECHVTPFRAETCRSRIHQAFPLDLSASLRLQIREFEFVGVVLP